MAAKVGHRAWGSIKKQRTKQASYRASFVVPDGRRHYGPGIFSTKMTPNGGLRARNWSRPQRRSSTPTTTPSVTAWTSAYLPGCCRRSVVCRS